VPGRRLLGLSFALLGTTLSVLSAPVRELGDSDAGQLKARIQARPDERL